jgi:3-hydroxybutyryl-CoA dehydratase
MNARQPEHLSVDNKTPGRLLSMSAIQVGDSVTQRVQFDAELRAAFSQLAHDDAPIHGDLAAANQRGYPRPILQGLCVSSRFSRLIGMYLPGESAVVESLAFKFRKPVYLDAVVDFTATVTRVMPALGVVRLHLTAAVEGDACVTGEAQCLLR